MKALVYLGPNKKSLENRPKPTIAAPTDAIVKITQTTICGTDLHILKGDVPTCTSGRILGHEGVGIVDAVGSAVTAFKEDDPVLIPAPVLAASASIADARCIRIAAPAAGFWAISLTARRRNSCASRMRT